jgi:catechol-2,3-dioxygenase
MSNPNPNPLAHVHLRMARPTNDIEAVKHFYHTALGLAVLSEFHGHFDFDEVMLGLGGHGYHLGLRRRKGTMRVGRRVRTTAWSGTCLIGRHGRMQFRKWK